MGGMAPVISIAAFVRGMDEVGLPLVVMKPHVDGYALLRGDNHDEEPFLRQGWTHFLSLVRGVQYVDDTYGEVILVKIGMDE